MSKQTTTAPKLKTPKTLTPAGAIAALNEYAAERKKYFASLKSGKVAVIATLVIFTIVTLAFAPAVALAGLYIFADNGKKSGRADGNVYMRNGRTRGFKVPALVRNSYTMTQRGIFAVLSAAYRGLTPAEIDAWMNFSYQSSNRFGQAITIRGKQAYVALNANLIDTGNATLTSPPVLTDVPAIMTVSAVNMDASAGTMTFAFSASPTDANITHLLFATKPLSNGITRPSKSAYRLVDLVPSGSTTPYDFASAYITKFGAITSSAGNKVFIQLYGVQNNTGQKIPSVGASGVIVP